MALRVTTTITGPLNVIPSQCPQIVLIMCFKIPELVQLKKSRISEGKTILVTFFYIKYKITGKSWTCQITEKYSEHIKVHNIMPQFATWQFVSGGGVSPHGPPQLATLPRGKLWHKIVHFYVSQALLQIT